MNVGPAVSSRLAWQRFFARTDFLTSKTSISRRSRPGSAAPFKGSRPDRAAFMLSTLSTSQAAKRAAMMLGACKRLGSRGCGNPMVESKQDRLANEVVELSTSFKMALSNKRKYPMAEFKSFAAAAKRYI